MDIESIYEKETGKKAFTYLNDYKEFVIDEDYFYWLECKVENALETSEGLWK